MLRHMVGLVGWFALVAAIAATAAQFSPGHWYASLQKPAGTPPGWVFGPVWSVLYIMMAVAVWLVWKRPGQPPLLPIGIFILQLMANAAWSWLFFGLQRPGLAFMDIAVLWILIVACLLAFRPHSKVAAWLMAPYLVWVTYAAYLNGALWILNRTNRG